MLRFHALGNWPPSAVRIAWAPSSRVVPPEVEAAVERAWAAAMARPDVRLFDGPMCRLESFAATAEAIELHVSRTGYKAFFGTNMADPSLADRFGAGVMANPVGVSVALASADGGLLMGRRNACVAYYPNRIHPFAGALEPEDGGTAGAGPDVFACARRELAEELRLNMDDVHGWSCSGLVEDASLRQPEVVLLAATSRTFEELQDQLDAAEHRSIESIHPVPTALERFLQSANRTPVAAAAALLWGRRLFGAVWFRQAAERLGISSNDGLNL